MATFPFNGVRLTFNKAGYWRLIVIAAKVKKVVTNYFSQGTMHKPFSFYKNDGENKIISSRKLLKKNDQIKYFKYCPPKMLFQVH